jgi:hypothetical protein
MPVQDLTVRDVAIVEDGTPQKIENLRHVSKPARSFVVFLDTPHMRFEGARNVRVALARFLDRLLDDDDLVGVMTPDIAPTDVEFEAKTAIIPRIMQDEALWERARVGSRDPKEDRYAQCFPANQYRGVAAEMQERHREQATLDALAALADFLSSSREDRTAVIMLTDGWRLFGPNPRLGGNVSSNRGGFGGYGGGGGRGRGGFPGGGFPRGGTTQGDDGGRDVSSASRTECEADRMALAALDDSLRLDRIADAANRAVTVVLHGVCAGDRCGSDAKWKTAGGCWRSGAGSGVAHGCDASACDEHRRHARDDNCRARRRRQSYQQRHERVRHRDVPLHEQPARWQIPFGDRSFAPSGCRYPHAPWLPRSGRRGRAGHRNSVVRQFGLWNGCGRFAARQLQDPNGNRATG